MKPCRCRSASGSASHSRRRSRLSSMARRCGRVGASAKATRPGSDRNRTRGGRASTRHPGASRPGARHRRRAPPPDRRATTPRRPGCHRPAVRSATGILACRPRHPGAATGPGAACRPRASAAGRPHRERAEGRGWNGCTNPACRSVRRSGRVAPGPGRSAASHPPARAVRARRHGARRATPTTARPAHAGRRPLAKASRYPAPGSPAACSASARPSSFQANGGASRDR